MIGILPCAGNATRIHGLPKYLLPVPGGYLLQRHINGMRRGYNIHAMIGANPDNWELLNQYARGHVYMATERRTTTETTMSVCQYAEPGQDILFGMPDSYWDDPDVYEKLCVPIWHGTADLTVALFKARPGQHSQGGMCRVEGGRIAESVDKPDVCDWPYIWGAMAWKPAFWDCLEPTDPHPGYGLPRAIMAGLDVRAVICEGNYYDCGTPERYFECIRSMEPEHAPA